MPTISYSKMAEIELTHEWLEDHDFESWLKNHATFCHNNDYEFVHHLHPVETERWFKVNCLIDAVPYDLQTQIIEARRNGCARVIFYV